MTAELILFELKFIKQQFSNAHFCLDTKTNQKSQDDL